MACLKCGGDYKMVAGQLRCPNCNLLAPYQLVDDTKDCSKCEYKIKYPKMMELLINMDISCMDIRDFIHDEVSH